MGGLAARRANGTPASRSAAARRPRRGATCCCRPCTPSRRGRAGSAAGALNYICQRLTIPPAEAYGVATFYALFSLEPQPPVVAHVCTDVACIARGSQDLVAELEREVGPEGQHPGNGQAIWLAEPVPRRVRARPGRDGRSVRRVPHEETVAPVTADVIADMLRGGDAPPMPPPAVPQAGDPGMRLLRRVGIADPNKLDSYRAHGGYEALRAAFDMGPDGVLREVDDAKLLGRGGAAFPTGRKWAAVARNAKRPKYLICNADESEPGTFKDRVILEDDPFFLVEAMTIAGYATGCEHGYLYLRGEYPLAWERLVDAITEARARGYLGDNILGQGIRFDIELRKGAGAYICGEETALFNSHRGLPRRAAQQAPVPGRRRPVRQADGHQQRRDARQRPRHRPRRRRRLRADRHEDSKGTRLFCLSGRVERPGLYEAPFGVTLRELIDMAGGVLDGRPLRTILLGGAAGRFVTPDELDVEMSFEATREAGVSMGSGRRHGRRRHRRPPGDPHAPRGVLPRRVVRPVRALPRRDRPPGGGARAASSTAVRAGPSRTSTRCSTRSRARCATRRSAASARRPRTRSSPR